MEKNDSKYDEVASNVSSENQSITNKDSDGGGGGVRLQAKMSLVNGVTVIVGSIIGSGIFISPKGVLDKTGSVNLALIVWTISGSSAGSAI